MGEKKEEEKSNSGQGGARNGIGLGVSKNRFFFLIFLVGRSGGKREWEIGIYLYGSLVFPGGFFFLFSFLFVFTVWCVSSFPFCVFFFFLVSLLKATREVPFAGLRSGEIMKRVLLGMYSNSWV